MLQLQSPIGSLIFHSHHDPVVLSDYSLFEKIENLIDIIQNRTIHKGIEYTSKSLYNELFEIRLHFANILVSKPELLDDLSNKILEEISTKYFLRNDHLGLGLLMSDALEVYYKIFSVVLNNQAIGAEIKQIPLAEMPKWGGFKIILEQYPNKILPPHLIAFMESSMDFDYALLLSEFVFRGMLDISVKVIDELKIFLKESLTRFGAYCVLTGYWKPDTADEHQIIRNIKIRAAVLRLESGQGVSYTPKNLHQLLNN